MSGDTTPDRGLVHDPPEGRRKNIDLVAGFVGWYLLNGLAWLLIGYEPYGWADSGYGLLLLPLNVILLILSLIYKRWIGLGILGALALNLFMALVMSAAANAACAVPFWVTP